MADEMVSVQNFRNYGVSQSELNEDYPSAKVIFQSKNYKSTLALVPTFARLDEGSDPENVGRMLSDQWELPSPPDLLIVVRGEYQLRQALPSRLKTILKRGLTLVLDKNTWVVTEGVATPLVSLVGEAVQDCIQGVETFAPNLMKVVALGIASCASVANHDVLRCSETYQKVCYYSIEEAEKSGTSPLDHHHTHFLLVDGERSERPRDQFRWRFEQYITNLKYSDHSKDRTNTTTIAGERGPVPSVVMVVGGGAGTLEEVVQILREERTVLVISGTGGVAQLLADTVHPVNARNCSSRKSRGSTCPPDLEGKAKELLDTWGSDQDVDYPAIVGLLEECQHKKHLLHVFRVDELDQEEKAVKAFKSALLCSAIARRPAGEQIETAMVWDCADIARDIFLPTQGISDEQYLADGLVSPVPHDGPYRMKMPQLQNHSMLKALLENKADFVQLFLDFDVGLEDVYSLETMWRLFTKVLKNEKIGKLFETKIKLLLDKPENKPSLKQMLKFLGRLDWEVEKLLGDARFHFYSGCFAKATTSDGWISDDEIKSMKKDGLAKFAERGFFIWALLSGRYQLSYLFWKTGQNQLGSALYASGLLRKMAIRATEEFLPNINADLEHHADLWETRAKDLLSVCYFLDVTLTHHLLQWPQADWGGWPIHQGCCPCRQGTVGRCDRRYWPTLLDMTLSLRTEEFVAHSACQTLIADLWYGRLPVAFSRLKIFPAILVPFLIFWSKWIPWKTERKSRCKDLMKIYDFYSAPATKFYATIVLYVMFMFLISMLVLFDLREGLESVTVVEILVHIWMLGFICEDLGQIRAHVQPSRKRQLKVWFWHQWKFDLFMYLTYVLSVVLRFSLLGEQDFKWARAVFCITAILSFQSCMQFLFAWKPMGPKIDMIEKMWKDFFQLMFMCLVLVVGFGVAFEALLYPESTPSAASIANIFYYPYFNIHGVFFPEFFLWLRSNLSEEPEGCDQNGTDVSPFSRCPQANLFVPNLLGVYSLLANVMMINLVIAQMSYTFQVVHLKAATVWCNQRLMLTMEYLRRPTLTTPLSLLTYIFWIVRRCCPCRREETKPATENSQCLMTFEERSLEKYLLQYHENDE